MLGLEAAVANLIRSGDKVIVVDNEVYGQAFADLVRSCGGVPVTLGLDWRRSADVSAVERAIEVNRDARA